MCDYGDGIGFNAVFQVNVDLKSTSVIHRPPTMERCVAGDSHLTCFSAFGATGLCGAKYLGSLGSQIGG